MWDFFARKCFLFLTIAVTFTFANEQVLVIHDGSNAPVTYSVLFDNLKKLGFEVSFISADDPNLQLVEYGLNKYENVILFAPNTDEFGGDLSPGKVAEYVDNGGNMLIGLDSRVTDNLRATVGEFGVEVDTEETAVIDHFHVAAADSGDHTLLSLSINDYYVKAGPFIPSSSNSDVLIYNGIGMVLDKNNELVYSILTAPSTSYSWIPEAPVTTMPMTLGKDTTLISAMEAKNNARVIISGSLRFFSDEFAADNEAIARQIALWCFQRAGVLKLSNVQHFLTDTKETLDTYTILDQVTFRVDIQEKNEKNEWVPCRNTDVQVEFTRIDPFVRQFLAKVPGTSTQELNFKIPDVYGVYKFIIDYKRIGYTYMQNQIQVPVRPLQHTQYERFIKCAYPYYAGAGSMLVGLFLFSFVFLYHK